MDHVSADMRARVRPGGVFWAFSGDYDAPYKFAKIIKNDQHGLCVKLSVEDFVTQPSSYEFADRPGATATVPIDVDVFMAWGPPKFPIFLADELVTEAEISACK